MRPPLLPAGAGVYLTAPASPVDPETAAEGIRALEELGCSVTAGPSLGRNRKGYAAGTPRQRAEELNAAFTDPAIDAIWCARGGYTAAALLPFLDYAAIARHPKPFIGYSDITALHAALHKCSGLITWHGPMACSDLGRYRNPETEQALLTMLRTGGVIAYRNPDGSPLRPLRPGRGEGRTAGGNLTVFCSLLGTKWMPETAGRVLFFEEVDESVPRVERMLVQLEEAGTFCHAAAVLLGSFTGCRNPYCPAYDIDTLLRDFFCRFSVPVVAGMQCGHCSPTGTLPLGGLCWVDDGRVWFVPDGRHGFY